jgi:hypothetical protein
MLNNEDQKPFIDFFPLPPEPNPFMFETKELYFNAKNIWFELVKAKSEREDILFKRKEKISEETILRWQKLFNEYQKALNEGLQERFKK